MKTRNKKIAKAIGMAALIASLNVFGTTAWAAVPVASNTGAVTVSNVESGATVTAYQIVKGTYSSAGLTGYETVDGVTIADISNPTYAEIQAIAANTSGLTSVELSGSGTSYSGNLNPGTWLILVTGSNDEIYSPMLASVTYGNAADDSTITAGTVDANGNLVLGGSTIVAKSSEPTVEKEIVDSGNNDKGDDLGIGDTAKFQISTTIPSYSSQYTSATFVITDTLDEGLKPATNIEVKDAAGNTIAASNYDLSQNGQTFTITFTKDYVLSQTAARDIVVTYNAVIDDDAAINFDANANTAKVTYTNNPTTGGTTDTDESKTYHYTFGIDAAIGGSETTNSKNVTKTETVVENGETVTRPLSGAVFTLYESDGTTKVTNIKANDVASDAQGQLKFEGLDAGTYILRETQAPTGYSLEGKDHKVVIAATYNEDGTLASYTITIDDTATSTYSATYDGGTTTVTKSETNTDIQNTKMGELPSTGGVGTCVFTICGVSIMLIAAGMLVDGRKRKAK